MKLYFLAIIAVLAVTMCVANEPGPGPDIGSSAPEDPENQQPVIDTNYCGVTINLISPSKNERVSGGFRVEWELQRQSGDYTNKQANFTIYLKTLNGATTDLKKVSRYYGELYKEDITFLSPVADGLYKVGVRGKMQDGCNIRETEVDIEIA